MTSPDLERTVAAVRRFNRFYTRRIGVLERGFLESPFSLAEVYEVAHGDGPTATELSDSLGLDPGYLSRMVRRFEQHRLVRRERAAADGRRRHLRLTPRGKRAFGQLERRQRAQVATMLQDVQRAKRHHLVDAMRIIEGALGARSGPGKRYTLRSPQPGDHAVQRHGALYAQEYRYDETFEALVARIVADYVTHLQPTRERCWIAELNGEPVGSVLLVQRSPTISQLRLLLVEPAARGLGVGRRLVEECIRFAQQVGYRKMVLWTQSELLAARRIYQRAGFHLTDRERHNSFGRRGLVAETWELAL